MIGINQVTHPASLNLVVKHHRHGVPDWSAA
jgi:hypothetical protein